MKSGIGIKCIIIRRFLENNIYDFDIELSIKYFYVKKYLSRRVYNFRIL